MERLDRALANNDWCAIYPEANLTHLPGALSDPDYSSLQA